MHAETTKNRCSYAITQAKKEMHHMFEKTAAAPTACILNNEVSKDLTTAFEQQNADY